MTNNNGNRIPENVTSYDIGNKPYKHDPGRGKWEKTWDFYAIALSHCCGFRHYLIFFALEPASAVIMSIAYMMGMLVFTLPVYFTQMFMGQFSSTGLISVFRIAPLFKSIGYISLFLNVMTCSYFMVATAFPLYIVFESMQTHLPWAHCGNHFNSEECEAIEPGSLNASMNFSDFYYEYSNNRTFPINEYLKYVFNGHDVDNNWYFSWRIMLCTLLIWVLIGLVLYNGVEMAGFATVSVLHSMADANKLIIILLELFVIVWIYGRLRFKRDVKFMTGKSIKSWKVWTMRFITPIAIAIALLVYIFESQYYRRFGHILAILIFAILKLTPTMYVPGYMIYKICTATGNVIDRIKKLCRPNDWYPADPIEHQNYENYLDNSDIANELVHANLITETVSF
ncbi:sodium-dependent nutrient amino acid transporter 1-like isoform X2 [Condylostylus longicornis]|uniref:sodium-dependent nutrient amino acid transporter 1-like isoform X2 n=1 Tax=Condylostylus longicornis TaxID=2530218 RepID=UPI00244DFA67|nr:sodium-dependent nutrient amino acid transporter 1-like isoform X2 [Condylostylus longicornis]